MGGAGMGEQREPIGGANSADMTDEGGHSPPRHRALEKPTDETRLEDAVNGSCERRAAGEPTAPNYQKQAG
jgi:hypothetical protein